MNIVRLAAVVLVATAAPALAQPGAEETPPPPAPAPASEPQLQPLPDNAVVVVAPMTESWSNVNHINGQIVKVGEKGDYLIEYKKLNISSNPIGWMFGVYGLSVSHAVSQHMAIRADGNLFNVDDGGGWEVGLTVPIYFRRVYSGPFLEGGLMIRQLDDEDCFDGECMQDAPNVGPQVMFGWQWLFDSGANVATAFGAFRPMNDGKTKDDVEPAFYFRIGYAY